MAEFTTTQRGARSLLIGGYSYKKGRDGTIFWRCPRSRNSHCTGTATTGADDTILTIKNTHNHPPDQAEIEVKKIVQAPKESSQANIRPVPQLYQEEIQKVAAASNSDEIASKMPTLVAIKSSLYRRRRKLIPPLPTTRADVHFDGEWAMTLKGEPFLLAEDGDDDKMVVFAMEDNMRTLAAADTLL